MIGVATIVSGKAEMPTCQKAKGAEIFILIVINHMV